MTAAGRSSIERRSGIECRSDIEQCERPLLSDRALDIQKHWFKPTSVA